MIWRTGVFRASQPAAMLASCLWWGSLSAQTPGVSGLVARVSAQGVASVSWQAFPKATRYFVVRWHVGDAACCKGMSPPALSGTTLSWQDAGLPKAGTYAYRVYATTAAGTFAGETRVYYESGVATTSEATGAPAPSGSTLGSMPGRTTLTTLQKNTAPAPTGLRVSGGVNYATVGWDPVSGATGYEVRRAVSGTTDWTLLTPTPTAELTFPGGLETDRLPDPTKSYTYQVTAIQADGGTASASISYTPPPPEDPREFSAVQTGEGQVGLSWVGPAGVTKFLLSGPGIPAGFVVQKPFDIVPRPVQHTVTGLPLGSATWTVAAMYEPGGVLTPSSGWPKATVSVDVRSGRYRVTMFAFEANTQTREGIALDGRGDEVYLAAFVATLNTVTGWGPKGDVKSLVFGDVFGADQRVLAGSASSDGGLKTGDVFPVGGATAPPGPPSANRLPMLLWEGILADDVDLVLIAPSIWEADGNDVNYGQWVTRHNNSLPNVIKWTSITSAIPTPGISEVRGGASDNTLSTTGAVVDHPIGMTSTLTYSQPWLLFTRRKIEGVLSPSSTIGGRAPGVIAVQMSDIPSDVNFGGRYTMYLRVERVP